MILPSRSASGHPGASLSVLLLAVLLAHVWVGNARAGGDNPLKPIDTSSPRSTLQGFMEFMNEAYDKGFGMLNRYLASSKLFLSPSDIDTLRFARHRLDAAERVIDFSALPPAIARESARRLTIQLKEILDRIELPSYEAIPDASAMSAVEFKRWTIPGSEIRIARMEAGARGGEYLFTAETVSRLSEFYESVRGLPDKAGNSTGFYEFSTKRPFGVALVLHRVIPPRWILATPRWAMATFLDQPLWRWLGIIVLSGAGLGVVLVSHRLGRRWRHAKAPAARWAALLLPVTLMIAAATTAFVFGDVLRISGVVYHAATLFLWGVFFLALTWSVWVTGTVVAEGVIRMEKLRASSIDSQLIRLVLRLITIFGAIAVLVVGADRVGLPAYSVVAGLGVGGLAVALAGQQTLANLLGSLIVMVEKPFRIGDWIKIGDMEGTVERVGFRSTRVRTFYDSLVTIPSSELVNTTIDNMGLRRYRRVRTVLQITYDTPAAQVEQFAEGVKRIIQNHPATRKDLMHIVFNDFGAHSLDILVYFFLKVPDWAAELVERQRILLEILQLANTTGIRFAFPTKTVHIESFPDGGVGEAAFITPGDR